MKKSQVVKLITFPILLTGCILALNFGLFSQARDDLTSYGQFYKEEEKCLDVVLIGNSTLREGYVPTRMWHNYGITSRGLSSSPTHPEVIKVAISEVMRFQEPKVVFIDLNGLTYQNKSDAEFFIKQYYKALPEGEFKNELEQKYDYLKHIDEEYELFHNHNNFRQQQYWESIVYHEQFITKGYYPNKIVHHVKPVTPDENTILDLPKDGQEYLDEIKAECLKYSDKTTFIFGKMPRYNANNSDLNSVYMFRNIANQIEGTSIKFMDFSTKASEIGLNKDSDFKDDEHLNHLGANKFTDYFANYLLNEIHLEPREKKQSVIDNFNQAYDDTKKYLDDIETYLRKKTGQL